MKKMRQPPGGVSARAIVILYLSYISLPKDCLKADTKRRGANMKTKKQKIKFAIAITMVFALTLGAAYAMEGDRELDNGITSFTGLTYDTVSGIGPVAVGEVETAVESSAAGGMRSDEPGIAFGNGITDFSGLSYDVIAGPGPIVSGEMYGEILESGNAGGLRSEEPAEVSNGITNFSGKSYDTLFDLSE